MGLRSYPKEKLKKFGKGGNGLHLPMLTAHFYFFNMCVCVYYYVCVCVDVGACSGGKVVYVKLHVFFFLCDKCPCSKEHLFITLTLKF